MELVEPPTRAAAHDASGAGAGGQDKDQDKVGTQIGEHAGERQTVTGLKKKGACVHVTRYIECGADGLAVSQIQRHSCSAR
jgi:hypothetical protein